MAAVERYERSAGRYPEAQPLNNPGFDIDSCNAAGETLRLIEVKSLAGDWGPGGFPKLTPTQWEMALDERERYWLYVVEHAESDAPVITRIQDPAGAVTRYVVDPGWRALAEPEVAFAASGDDDPRPRRRGGPRPRDACRWRRGRPPGGARGDRRGRGRDRSGLVRPSARAWFRRVPVRQLEGWTLVRADETSPDDLLRLLDGVPR